MTIIVLVDRSHEKIYTFSRGKKGTLPIPSKHLF